MTTHPTADIEDLVLRYAGATLPRPDAVDERIVQEVIGGIGSVGIGSHYPVLRPGVSPNDTDHDGMPDSWELPYGLNPEDPSDRNGDLDSDGYTNVEEYLNELVARGIPDLSPSI